MKKIPIEIVQDKLHMMLAEIYPDSPEVLRAELGSVGGLHGALAYLKGL